MVAASPLVEFNTAGVCYGPPVTATGSPPGGVHRVRPTPAGVAVSATITARPPGRSGWHLGRDLDPWADQGESEPAFRASPSLGQSATSTEDHFNDSVSV